MCIKRCHYAKFAQPFVKNMVPLDSLFVRVRSELLLDIIEGCPSNTLQWSEFNATLSHGILTGNGVTCLGYADDIVIMAKGKFEGALCDLVERELETTIRWCLSVGLRINSSKTTVVPFTRRTRLQHLRNIRLNDKHLEWRHEVKYLGLTLDSKLLWNRHVEKIASNKAISLPTGSAHLADLPTNEIVGKFNFEKQFRTELSTKRDWSRESIQTLEKNTIIWYTDGPKAPDGTGAGVYGPRTKYSHEPMGQFPSIFQVEIHAMERCIQFNLDRKYRNKEIAILSDSQAAIKALSSSNINSIMVLECLGKLNDLGRNSKVTLLWVPGHVRVEGNEQADTLARKDRARTTLRPWKSICPGST